MTIADCVAVGCVTMLIGFVLGLLVRDWFDGAEYDRTTLEELGDG